jgi:hypothetical protein
VQTSALRKIRFSYPEQHDFPPREKDFDAESLFWRGGHLYLLTKHRSNTRSNLYRFDTVDPHRDNPLTLIDSFAAGGMVTATDASDDGSVLAILTYHHIWLIELPTAKAGTTVCCTVGNTAYLSRPDNARGSALTAISC